jgi:hypothetical protein
MHRDRITLENLPLYADEASIAVAILGRKRTGEWSQIAALLEARGLPKIDDLMGGRYVPAVKAFFDKEHGLTGAASPLAPDGTEDLGAWKRKRARQA